MSKRFLEWSEEAKTEEGLTRRRVKEDARVLKGTVQSTGGREEGLDEIRGVGIGESASCDFIDTGIEIEHVQCDTFPRLIVND